MAEIMPFGRMKDLSVEQIALKDYKYFVYIMDNIPIKKYSLGERFDFVENVVNNFRSVKPCGNPGCQQTPRLISVCYEPSMNYRGSSPSFIYCSKDCFDHDPKVSPEKTSLEPLKFRTAISSTKFDTNDLVKVMAQCMGLPPRLTKEGLEKFFNNVQCW